MALKIHDPMPLEALSAIEHLLTDEEKMIRDSVRRFVKERFLPRAGKLFENEEFPVDLIPEMASMGLLGASLEGLRVRRHGRGRLRSGIAGARVRRRWHAQLRERAGVAMHVSHPPLRLRRAEGALPSEDGEG